MPGIFDWFSAFGFGGKAKDEGEANKFSNEQFGGVFEEMLRYVCLRWRWSRAVT